MLKTSMKLLPLLVLGAVSGTASAAGFQLLEQNATGLGNAYAGSAASSENASSQYFNAASLTALEGRQFSVGVNYIELTSKFHNRNSSNPLGHSNLANDGVDGGDAAFVPNFYYAMPLTKDLYFGVGVNAPFGMRTDWAKGWQGQFFGTLTDVKAMNFNANLAYRVNDVVSIGGGVNYQKFDAQLESMLNGAISMASPFSQPTPSSDGRFSVAGNSWAWGYNLGALFQVAPATRIGISYRSAIRHELSGKYGVSGFSGAVATMLPGAYGFTGGATGNAKVNIKLPSTFILSATHQINNKWEVLGDLSRTSWSDVPELRVQFANGSRDQVSTYNWRDTWRVAVGANYQASDDWKLRLGLAFDQSPVKEGLRTPRLPDQDRVWYSIGAQYKVNSSSKIDIGYSFVKAKNANAAETSANPAVTGTLDGTYKSHVQVLGVQYSMNF